MDFDRASWFMLGLIVGNSLHTTTTIILLSIWMIISNNPLPLYLGGAYPQDVLALVVGRASQRLVGFYVGQGVSNRQDRLTLIRNNSAQSTNSQIVELSETREVTLTKEVVWHECDVQGCDYRVKRPGFLIRHKLNKHEIVS